ncbi:MAG: phosphopentomutase [Candidatus Wallbacteria bacterium]|nr:phosphopentomutase [Candidatus Wallbacteria bacterium]
MIERITVIVCDSFGVGEMPDAASYGDAGSHTLGGICRVMPGLTVPNLVNLGLGNIAPFAPVPAVAHPLAAWGKMAEASPGKDTTTGHWEMMGLVLNTAFPVYPNGFPRELMETFEKAIGRKTLGNRPASGTEILTELGEEHMRTGSPIVYTSGDSVFQVAAHEEVIAVPELYKICETARDLLRGPHEVGRVIARPFVGKPGAFKRTYNRHDYAVLPAAPTLLDLMVKQGIPTYGIGKIGDIFCGQGIGNSRRTQGNPDGMTVLAENLDRYTEGFHYLNLVDFDQNFGHRRDPVGYGKCLEEFDRLLPSILTRLSERDLLFITADHGNDPTFKGTDHCREYVPIIAFAPGRPGLELGVRTSFADLAATIADVWNVPGLKSGRSFAEAFLGSH